MAVMRPTRRIRVLRRDLGLTINGGRLLSSSSSSSKADEPPTPTPTGCDVVSGPSLLRTSYHRPRPSLLHLPGLRSLPFWTQQQYSQSKSSSCETRVAYQDPSLTWAINHFEENWETILDEYKSSAPKLSSDYQADTEHGSKLHRGSWDWHSYMLKGQAPQPLFARHFPQTTALLHQVREKGLLFENVPFGYTFFSTLHANSQINAHSAPMNLRVRLHLPLLVPTANKMTTADPPCGIRVGPVTREWVLGKAMLLDDSYDHEVWNHADTPRVILLVDLWHPDVTPAERQDIISLFDHAKKEGWWTTP